MRFVDTIWCTACICMAIGCQERAPDPQAQVAEHQDGLVVVDSPTIDLGVMDKCDVVQVEWQLRNGTHAMANIKTTATCGCTNAVVEPPSLEPGQMGYLRATISCKAEGPFRVSIRVACEGQLLTETVVLGAIEGRPRIAAWEYMPADSGFKLGILFSGPAAPTAPPTVIDFWDTGAVVRSMQVLGRLCRNRRRAGRPGDRGLWLAWLHVEQRTVSVLTGDRLRIEVGDDQADFDLGVLRGGDGGTGTGAAIAPTGRAGACGCTPGELVAAYR